MQKDEKKYCDEFEGEDCWHRNHLKPETVGMLGALPRQHVRRESNRHDHMLIFCAMSVTSY